jgi:hypothetical protein
MAEQTTAKSIQPHDPDIHGAGFGDQLRVQLALTGDPEDRILVEIANEIDRLEGLMGAHKPSGRAQLATRRVTALTKLYGIVQDRRESKHRDSEAAVAATIIRHLRACLREMEMSPEMEETLIENLINKISEADEKPVQKK